jgi:uncharacterized protein (TIGR00645 family)
MRRGEQAFQQLIFVSRWLVVPFLFGMLVSMFLLIYRFFAELFELAKALPSTPWHDLVVGILNLVDIALVANLVLIVIFAGYENFIGKIGPPPESEWPSALAAIDFAALKQKLLSSIAGIAAIDALAWYLDLEKYGDTSKLGWAIAFPLMFVVSLLMLAVADRLSRKPKETGQ